MTPIEAALARVRELREIEKRMTLRPWRSDMGFAGSDHLKFLVRTDDGDGHLIGRGPNNEVDTDGIAALRNAAEPMLDLLEALLEERQVRIAHWQRQHHEVESEFAAVNDALAAFVEGK